VPLLTNTSWPTRDTSCHSTWNFALPYRLCQAAASFQCWVPLCGAELGDFSYVLGVFVCKCIWQHADRLGRDASRVLPQWVRPPYPQRPRPPPQHRRLESVPLRSQQERRSGTVGEYAATAQAPQGTYARGRTASDRRLRRRRGGTVASCRRARGDEYATPVGVDRPRRGSTYARGHGASRRRRHRRRPGGHAAEYSKPEGMDGPRTDGTYARGRIAAAETVTVVVRWASRRARSQSTQHGRARPGRVRTDTAAVDHSQWDSEDARGRTC